MRLSKKLWLMNKICWLWDVIFTRIDMFQLRIWVKLRNYRDELEYQAKDPSNDFNNLEDWDS